MTPYEAQLEHLIKLRSTRGWHQYATKRAEALEQESPIWQGISEHLKREMAARKPPASS